MTQKFKSFDDAAIVAKKGHDYRINFWFLPKNEAVGRMKDANQSENSGQL